MIAKKIEALLKERAFISIATCDLDADPNAAPKLLLKSGHNFVYLVDYSIGRTWENLKVNPRASLSFMDTNKLTGYQINGPVDIIEKGPEYESILSELRKKEIDLSIERIIQGVNTGKKHESFEMSLPEHVVVFKVKIEEVVEITPRGELKRERV